MALAKDPSVVADSVAEPSSPSTSMNISSVVQRARKTYGRRRDDPGPDSNSSLASHPDSNADTSRLSVYRTGPSDVNEEIPASSDPFELPPRSSKLKRRSFFIDDDDDDEIVSDAPADFEFSWRKDLKAMDEMSDTQVAALTSNFKYKECHRSPPRSVHGSVDRDAPSSPHGMEPEPDTDNVFSDALPLTTDTDPSSQFRRSKLPSPSRPRTTVGHHRVKQRVDHDSNSDSEIFGVAYASSPTSPLFPHPIVTPEQHSPPTPPTSDVEVPSSKAKEKASVRGVPHLSFDETLTPSEAKGRVKKNINGKGKEKQLKVKAPTKKELKEIALARHRINADRHSSIPRMIEPRHNICTLLQKFNRNSDTVAKAAPFACQSSSDPIQSFSSSPAIGDRVVQSSSTTTFGVPTTGLLQSDSDPSELTHPVSSASVQPPPSRLLSPEDLEDDLPELSDILQEQQEKLQARKHAEDVREKARVLAEVKKRALAQQALLRTNDTDEEDDLVVERIQAGTKEEQEEQRYGHHGRPEEGRKRQLVFGRVRQDRDTPAKKSRDKFDTLALLAAGAKSAFGEEGKVKSRGIERSSRNSLNKALILRVDAERTVVSRKKEEEWERLGGKITREESAGEMKDIGNVVSEYMRVVENVAGLEAEDDGSEGAYEEMEGSDEEWNAEIRGSAILAPVDFQGGSDQAAEVSESEEHLMDDRAAMDDDDEDYKENHLPRASRRSATRLRALVESDEEDENAEDTHIDAGLFDRPLIPGAIHSEFSLNHSRKSAIVHRGSLSSFDDPTEDENDKENDTRLMFDRSEDKENKAVVRHTTKQPPLGSRASDLHGLEERLRRGLSTSPGSEGVGLVDEDEERMPFKELVKDMQCDASEEDVFGFNPSRKVRDQMQSAGPSPHSPSPAPLNFSKEPLDFSQFQGDTPGNDKNVLETPVLQPGFVDLFEAATAEPATATVNPLATFESRGFPQLLPSVDDKEEDGLRQLRRPGDTDNISLTLDMGLQPALEVNENIRRQADNIFEKEQEYVVEIANRKEHKRPELYVNDYGFLTQTRPRGTSPEVYNVSSSSQMTAVSASQNLADSKLVASERRPLRTLSVSEELQDVQPLRRLQKRRTVSFGERSHASLSPSPAELKISTPINAFDILNKASRMVHLKQKKTPLGKSEYVAGEAEESDDDELIGFGLKSKGSDDEGSGGEDQDATLAELVDDNEMDAETEARELVLEKVKEHQDEDDREIEKVHRDAIEGKFRTKRRDRGIGLGSDSEDDSEDEQAERLRRKMHKRRKIEDDTLEALGENEETRAFYNAYQRDLVDVDEDNEFSNLRESDTMMGGEEEEEGPQETVSVDEIRRRMREVAQRMEMSDQPLDLQDISWLDRDGSDGETEVRIRVKEVTVASKRQPVAHRSGWGQSDFDGNLELSRQWLAAESEPERKRLSLWAKTEGRTRNMGTGRSAVGAAVTGHGTAKVKTGGGSLLRRVGSSTSAPIGPHKHTKTPSILSAVSDRTSRFA